MSWQRIVPQPATSSTPAIGQKQPPSPTQSANLPAANPANPAPAQAAAKGNAEDFLNQQGASAGFED